MLNTILRTITGYKKSSIIFIIFVIILGSFFEILGLGAIIPLLSFFIENTENNFIVNILSSTFPGIDFEKNFLIYAILFILVVFYLRFFFLLYLTIKINYFIFSCQKMISEKLLHIYFDKDYSWHTENNKSRFINLLTSEVGNFCQNGLYGFLFVVSEMFFLISIVIFFTFWKTEVFLIVMAISVIFFPTLIYFTRKVSYNLGLVRQKVQSNILKNINENLNGIKEMLLYRWGDNVKKNYSDLAQTLVNISAKHNSMQDIGRYLIEIIGITLLVIFIFILTKTEQSGNSFITLAVFGAALFRIMPILNRISTFSQRLKYSIASSIKISEFYNNKENKVEIFNHLDFQEKIKFEDISYKFKGKRDFIIKNLNFEINKNEIFGILGESGIGKTTLSNIIMGLIKPSSGKIIVDGKNIIDEKLSIQNNIAFVPQNFFYTDDTLINNITFFEKKINLSNLKFAIKNSLLINPILNKSLSLKTDLGNNALKISGGQLQRISLARALYRRPKILVLDEPTSFLDKKNQDLLKEILVNLRKRITIILISHNKNIFEECDKILDLDSKKN